ncbi:MAG: hypothetical protein GY785_02020 [Gammaproteobacteria bacterium]|nr:hypothetical protein [Gammaproteobacteria bacterium]
MLACTAHATLFYLRWNHNVGATAQILTVTFWIAVSSLLGGLILLKGSSYCAKLGLLAGAIIIVPGALTCINWTIWSVLGLLS